jgi:DNA-binding NtrC family response regulator
MSNLIDLFSNKQTARVMIIEDEAELLNSLLIAIKLIYPNSIGFKTILEASSYLEKNSVDVIISDHNLGNGLESGLHLYKECLEKKRNIPFILMSGDSSSVHFQTIECGFEYPKLIVEKPFKVKDILRLIETELRICSINKFAA